MKRKEFFRGLITALRGGNLENKIKWKIIKKIIKKFYTLMNKFTIQEKNTYKFRIGKLKLLRFPSKGKDVFRNF